jgi:hypothetical protein
MHRRLRLGIPNRWSKKVRRPWTAETDQLLGTGSDPEIAEILCRSTTAVFQRRRKLGIKAAPNLKAWTQAETALLGTMPDSELARLTGRDHFAVSTMRRKRGKPYSKPTRKPWTENELALLGKMSDREVARRTGRTAGTVRQARFKRRISYECARGRWRTIAVWELHPMRKSRSGWVGVSTASKPGVEV